MEKRITILALHLGAGGAERVIINLANLLCEECQVDIISTYRLGDKPAFPLDERVSVQYLLPPELSPNREKLKKAIEQKKPGAILREGMRSLRILYLRKKKMVAAIRNLHTDVAVSTRVMHSLWLGKYAPKGIIKIAQEHNHHEDNPKIIHAVLSSLKHMDYFMPTSRYLAEFYEGKIREQGLDVQVKFIPNYLTAFPVQTAAVENERMLAVGRLEEEKGFGELVDIFAEIHEQLPRWTLSIVGEGSQRAALEEKIKSQGLDSSVFLKGQKLGADLEQEYQNAGVYLMTSYRESFGLVLLEAESYGIPLMAYDSAQGAGEIISQGVNGMLVPGRDRQAYIRQLLSLARDPELRRTMGAAGRELSENYKKEHVSKKWKEFLSELFPSA